MKINKSAYKNILNSKTGYQTILAAH